MLNGQCVAAGVNGACAGTPGMIANNVNGECDSELPFISTAGP